MRLLSKLDRPGRVSEKLLEIEREREPLRPGRRAPEKWLWVGEQA